MSGVVLGLALVFGLLIGSFLNVVAHRVPAGLSVVYPASACPGCSTPLAKRDNIPLFSWIVLRGACRTCRMPISVRYPIVELATGVAFVLAALPLSGALDRSIDPLHAAAVAVQIAAYLYFAAISVVLTAIDLDVRRLPDRIVLPAYAVGALLLTITSALRLAPVPLALGAAGAGASFLLYFLLAVAKPGGMGLGDVKLAGVLGLYLGFLGLPQLVVGVAAGFVLGGVFGVLLLAVRRSTRRTAIPFGPWLLAGAWIGVFFGTSIARAYLSLVGLG